jgi:uncharacterized membrane protein YgdD (TMEM256/DUF423 family)
MLINFFLRPRAFLATPMKIVTVERLAAALGFSAVALGAFGAHALKNVLVQNGTTGIWQTAVFYHFIHTVMLFVVAGRPDFSRLASYCFLAGIVIFSGSLYLLAVTNLRWLGVITPLGGLCLLAGWLCLWLKR